jgi:hypothetical protein
VTAVLSLPTPLKIKCISKLGAIWMFLLSGGLRHR